MRTATSTPDASVTAATIADGGAQGRGVGGDAGDQRADRIAEVAPEPIHADGRCSPGRVRDVADRGEQRRIHHRRPEPEQDGADGEAREAATSAVTSAMPTACIHMPPDDEPLAPDPVRQRAGEELRRRPTSPDRWPRATDLRRSCPAAAKNSGNSPHAIPSFRLLTRPAWLTLERFRSRSDVRTKISRWDRVRSAGAARAPLRARVVRVSRTTATERTSPTRRSRRRDRTAAAETVARRDQTGRQRRAGDREVSGELVQAHREPALFRARRGRSS